MPELLYIDHRILEEELRPDVDKVAAIKGMARPQSSSDIHFWVCAITSPGSVSSQRVTEEAEESNTEFHWTSMEQEALDEIVSLAKISFWLSMI